MPRHLVIPALIPFYRRDRSWQIGLRRLLISALATVVAACGGTTYLSPCQRMDTEPLEIRRIFDSVTGAILSPAVLTEFTINGDPWSAPALQGPSSSGVSVITRDSLRCEPPCKFGGEAGNYEFLVLTEGYQPKRVKFFVDWLEKIPNHPCTLPTLRGETEVEIGLEKKR